MRWLGTVLSKTRRTDAQADSYIQGYKGDRIQLIGSQRSQFRGRMSETSLQNVQDAGES